MFRNQNNRGDYGTSKIERILGSFRAESCMYKSIVDWNWVEQKKIWTNLPSVKKLGLVLRKFTITNYN